MRAQWKAWLDAGKTLAVIDQTPSAPFSVASVAARADFIGHRHTIEAASAAPEGELVARLAQEFLSYKRFRLVSINDKICRQGRCSILDRNGYPIFKDRDHITARWIRENGDSFLPLVDPQGPTRFAQSPT